MAGGQTWRQNIDADDVFSSIDKRISAQERRAQPAGASETLGPGLSARAIQILDWNTEEALFNGYYWSIPGALHSPDSAIPWTGLAISKDDGSGMQQVWNVDPTTGIASWMRTWITNETTGGIEFLDWRKFATESGMIGEPEIDQPVLDNIQQGLDDAAAAFEFAESKNRVFRQPDPPATTPEYELRENDFWFDTTDSEDQMHLWDGAAWVQIDDPLAVLAQEAADAAMAAAVAATAEAEAAFDYAAASNATFRQDNPPASDGSYTLRADDTWYDTNDSNRIRTWNGSAWVDLDLGFAALGTVLQTETTASRGVKINSGGLIGYDTSGVTKFLLTTAGALSMSGNASIGGTIDGAVVTGGTVQTEATVARGIKVNSAGLTAYNGSGTPTLTITASTGAISMLGSLTSGSTVTGATITGGVVETIPTANRGIKLTSSYLYGYNSSGVVKTYIDANTGLFSGTDAYFSGTVDASNVVGGTVQTSGTANVGVKMTSTGIVGYGSGVPKFVLSATTGEVTSISVTGGTVTGATLQTAANGERIVISPATGLSDVLIYSGVNGEQAPSTIGISGSSSILSMVIAGPRLTGNSAASLWFTTTNSGAATIQTFADQVTLKTGSTLVTNDIRPVSGSYQVGFGSDTYVNMPGTMKSGTRTVNVAAANANEQSSVTFPVAFTGVNPVPLVFLTAVGLTGNTALKLSPSSITRSGFTINVVRTSGTGNVDVQWLAVIA